MSYLKNFGAHARVEMF